MLLPLLTLLVISFLHSGLASADYNSIPKIKQTVDNQTGLYDETVNLNAGTNNPSNGGGAQVPDSYFKLYTTDPSANRTINIYITFVNSPANCSGYGLDSEFYQPDGAGNPGPTAQGYQTNPVTNCGNTYPVTVPASAWSRSSIPGQTGVYFTVLHMSINDITRHKVSDFRIDTSATFPDTHIGNQAGGYTTIFPQVNSNLSYNGLHTISVPFAPSCGTAPAGTITWGDDDQANSIQPPGANMRIDLIVTDLATGGTSVIALANNSIGGFSYGASRSYGPPPGGWQTNHSYTLQFSNVAGGNGIWFRAPFDEGNAYTPCPVRPPIDIPPAFTFSADCHIIAFNGMSDPNDNGTGVHYFGQIFHRKADGGKGTSAGTFQGYGLGTFSIDYRNPNPPAEAFNSNYGWYIEIAVHNILVDGNPEGALVDLNTNVTPSCYTAHCTNLVVDGALSDTTTGVPAGSTFSVKATYHNDQPLGTTDYLPANLSDGSNTFHLGAIIYDQSPWTRPGGTLPGVYGSDVPLNGDFTVTISGLRAPSTIASTPLTTYAYYWGLFGIDSAAPCTANIKTYLPFHLNINTPNQLEPTVENPSESDYQAWVNNPANSQNVYAPLQSYFYKIIGGVTTRVTPTYTGGTFAPDSDTYYLGSSGTNAVYTIPHPPPNQAGDTYCSAIAIGYTDGFVGPGTHSGTYSGADDPTDVAQTSGGGLKQNCPKIVNEPYFRAFNSSASAGTSYPPSGGGSCSGGKLSGWNNNTGTNPNSGDFGAGTQLSALAAGAITGFASNQKQTVPLSLNGPPTALTFSNTTSGDISTGVDSPKLGGTFGITPCLPVALPPTPGPGVDSTTVAGPYYLNPAGQTTILPGDNKSVFVNGNVYITNNVVYRGDNGLTGRAAAWKTKDVPSFALYATGNIYIAPGVTELDGIYSAQPSGTPHSGTIYTCGIDNGGGNFTPMASNDLLDNCKNQLTLYGNFVADHVNLMRTFGSLRDEQPISGSPGTVTTTPATQGTTGPIIWEYDGSVSNPAGYTCTPVFEVVPLQPASTLWNDNRLCVKNGTTADSGAQAVLKWTTNAYAPEDPGAPTPEVQTGLPDCTASWGQTVGPYGYPVAQDPLPHPPGGFWWNDNYLCSNYPITFSIAYTDPSNTTRTCALIREPSDGYGSGLFQGRNTGGFPWVCMQKYVAGMTTTTPPGPSVPNPAATCSNPGGVRSSPRPTCAAEVFDFSPELYLANPAISPPSNGALKYKAVTGLPPVL